MGSVADSVAANIGNTYWTTKLFSKKLCAYFFFISKRAVVFKKWPVVFYKTSRRLQQNDLSFFKKWPVVFWVVCASKIQTSPCVKSTRNRSDNFEAKRWKWTFSKTKKKENQKKERENQKKKRDNSLMDERKTIFWQLGLDALTTKPLYSRR